MKLYQIINAIPALNKLGGSDMKIAQAYALQKLLAAIQAEIDFFNANYRKLIDAYGLIQDDGTFHIHEDNQAGFKTAMGELSQVDVEPAFTKITITTNENIHLSANDVGLLKPFVEFTEEET